MMYLQPHSILYADGQWIEAKDAGVNPLSQTLHYGYGLFDGLRAYKTINGVKIFRAKEHFERMISGCASLRMPIPLSPQAFTQIAYRLLEKNQLQDAYIRPIVYCRDENLTLNGNAHDASLIMAAWEWGKLLGNDLLHTCISSYRRHHPATVLVENKVCGYYVNSILAKMEATRRQFDEAILLDCDGNIAGGTGTNFFFEKNNTLYTPPCGHIFPGITRKTVIDICQILDINVVEQRFTPEKVFEADSAFLCGTASEIAGLATIEKIPFRKPWKESLGALIQEAYACFVLDKSFNYLTI